MRVPRGSTWFLFLALFLAVCSVVVSGGCAAKKFWVYGNKGPVRWKACERRLTRTPAARNPARSATAVRRRFLEPMDRLLSLERTTEALNVNVFDMVPDSNWFTNRLGLGSAVAFYTGKSQTAVPGGEVGRFDMATGPATTTGPSALGRWRVVAAGRDREGPYLLILDRRQRHYLLRFDAPGWPGLGTSAELVSSLLLHAAGYRVEELHMVFFQRRRLVLSASARYRTERPPLTLERAEKIEGKGRPLNRTTLDALLAPVPRMNDGSFRAVATRLQTGNPLGPFSLFGRRPDDPNDRVAHQHRRELRGLRLIAAWLNLAGLNEHSSMDLFRDGRVVHMLTNLRPSLGSTDLGLPKGLKESLGGVVFPKSWMRSIERIRSAVVHRRPAVGFITAVGFRPDLWLPASPHPAFARATRRDLFWAGRILAAFTKEKIRSAIEAAMLRRSDTAMLTRILWERARRAARHGLSRSGPFGFFGVGIINVGLALCATDLWRHAGLDGKKGITYQAVVADATGRRRFYPIVRPRRPRFCVPLGIASLGPRRIKRYVKVSLYRLPAPSRRVIVHLRTVGKNRRLRVVGVRR